MFGTRTLSRPAFRRSLLGLALVGGLVGSGASGTLAAGTPAKTSVGITRAAIAGSKINLTGSLALGSNAFTPTVVSGAATCQTCAAPNGLALGTSSIHATPDGYVIFDITIGNPAPGAATPTPNDIYGWQFSVDGKDSGKWVQGGYLSEDAPPKTSVWGQICGQQTGTGQNTLVCNDLAGATITNNVVELKASYKSLSAQPGSTIGSGAGYWSNYKTVWTAIHVAIEQLASGLYGSTSAADDYMLPGAVSIGIGKAGANPSTFTYSPATVTGGAWTGSLAKPTAHGSYTIAARTCWGDATTSLTCVTATRAIRV